MVKAKSIVSAAMVAAFVAPSALAHDWVVLDKHTEGGCAAMLFPSEQRQNLFVVQFHSDGKVILTYSEPNLPKTNQEVFRVEVLIGNSRDVAIGTMTDLDTGNGRSVRGISAPIYFEAPIQFFKTKLGVALMSGAPLRFSVPVMNFSFSVPTTEFPDVAEEFRDCLSKVR